MHRKKLKITNDCEKLLHRARRMRKALGGGMRQTGIIAAAAIYSLENIVPRLKDDHKNLRNIAQGIHSAGNPEIFVDLTVLETNILLVRMKKPVAPKLCVRFSNVLEGEKGHLGFSLIVKCFPWDDYTIRFVTHVDISTEMAEKATQKIVYVIKTFNFDEK